MGVLESFVKSWDTFSLMFMKYIELFSNLFSGHFFDNVSGPVGIANASAEAVSGGILGYLKMSIMLSFALGFMNLIPLTVLDGGRALISLFETIFRTKFNETMFKYTSFVSASLLIGLLVFTLYKDILM
jgi:regulator of sigma E protease